MRRRRKLIVAGVVLVAVAGGATWWGLAGTSANGRSADAQTTDQPAAVQTEQVTRGDLANEYEFTGQVSFGDPWSLPLAPGGVVTRSRPLGEIVDFGTALIWVDDKPVVLAQGDVPMHRQLALASPHMTGADVTQLQQFLVSQGYDDEGLLEVDGEFGTTTRDAVKDWQDASGLDDTGRVDGAQLIFSPSPLRMASDHQVGTTFDGVQVTDATAVVTTDTSTRDRSGVPVGGDVAVELADGTSLPGVVRDQERVIQQDGSTLWRSTIEVDGVLGGDETSVLITSKVVEVADVLIVPVSALLAVANGGFALEVQTTTGTKLVPVEVGSVVDTNAQVSGAVDVGDRVVVAA
jgi:peptidoglycan hydrolase-like protein with peptidoglycan-binding domain